MSKNPDIILYLIEYRRAPLDLFCQILDGEMIPYTVSGRFVRNLPKVELPQA